MITPTINKKIFEENWNQVCDCHLGEPIELSKADLKKPFIYQRGLGVMYVSGGYHQVASMLLMAFNMNLDCGIEAEKELKNQGINIGYRSDYYLMNTIGTAMKSSVGKTVIVGKKGNLNDYEIRWFGQYNIEYLT